MMKRIYLLLYIVVASVSTSLAQIPSTKGFDDGVHHWNLLHKDRSYPRLTNNDYIAIADNLLAYQNKDGGWMKNIDWFGILNVDSVINELTERYRQSTLDNRNTFPQIEYLAEVYRLTDNKKYAEGSMRGIMYLMNTQEDNGGWRGWDVDAITLNDEVTTGALHLFQRIIYGDSVYNWIDDNTKAKIAKAYDKGIATLLKCQIVQNGKKTAWAQQHDNITLLPTGARTFELPGITASESCPVIELLMNIENPSPQVIDAVECAIGWLKESQLKGIRIEKVPLPEEKQYNHEYPFDRVVVNDTTAKPIWARFYDLENNTPFFCRRDGQRVATLAEVNGERRTGYDWYGYWPESVLKRYEIWKKKH